MRKGWSGKKFHKGNFSGRKYVTTSLPIHAEQLTESEVGITEYISELEGFSGVLKARFSDFQVNEINIDGEIAKLTNTQIPPDFKPDIEEVNKIPENSPSQDVPQKIWIQILNMMENGEPTVVELDVSSMDKKTRESIHTKIKKIFKQKIVASTVNKEEKKFIQFKKYNKEDKQDVRVKWPEDKGEYVHFLVYKENNDTLSVALKLSQCLRIKSSAFTYAGVKDRRSKSTQWFCVRKVQPWKLLKRTRMLRNIHIGNITFKDEPLQLGQLKGNQFRIALRNITASDDLINRAMESLKKKGFINYFGLQRFGNDKEVPTYHIGIQLLLGNFKEACKLILKCKKNDNPVAAITKAKKIYNENGDAVAASNCLDEDTDICLESKLIYGLAKSNTNDYVNALENVPRNMRLLYIHSFQSFIWNRIISKRISELGLNPIVGDLVIIKTESDMDVEIDIDNNTTENDEFIESNEMVQISETTDSTADYRDDNKKEEISNKEQVKILNKEDLENYSIYDIVLPLPGYDIVYPNNIVKDWYKEMLEEHGLSLEMPVQSVKTYTLSGKYRYILSNVKDLKWNTMQYSDPNDNLIRSDFEEMIRKKEPEDQPDGQYKALIIDFCLGQASYATMVIREILKTDTSSSAQSKLNNYHESKVAGKSSDTVPTESCAQQESLLSNPEKFEEFKKSIFGTTLDDTLKRKHEEDDTDVAAKKSKQDNNDDRTDCALILEPSLV